VKLERVFVSLLDREDHRSEWEVAQ
jgi:hypothetical protein